MTNKEQLKKVLKELGKDRDSAQIKARAAKFLKDVAPQTLSLAEQELMEEGVVSQEELRSLCAVHLEILGGALERQKPQLDSTHPVGILMDEHRIILRNLDELRRLVGQVGIAKSFDDIGEHLTRLKVIAHLLLDTESHHKREEEALFPRLERRGVTGPPRIMRLEHEELRAAKRRLAELSEIAEKVGFATFAQELKEVGNYISMALADHIFKEDNILYPTALQTLEPQEWSSVIQEFDRIGYCSFTQSKN